MFTFPSTTRPNVYALRSLTAALLCMLPLQALAQVPPSASADRIYPQRPSNSITLIPPAPLSADEAQIAVLPRPPGAENVRLTLTEIALEDVNAIAPEKLAALWQDKLNTDIALADVYAIADKITAYYRDAGFVLARAYIPQQEISDGRVRIAVAEGRIGHVLFEAPFPETNLITMVLDGMRQLPVLNIRKLENQLLLLGDLPGTSFHVVLQPDNSGFVNVVVVGEQDPTFSGTASLDNSGSRYLGPYLLSATVDLANLPALFHQTSLTVSTALQLQELAMVAGSHSMPLGRPDLMLTVDTSYTKGEPGYVLTSNEIDSRSLQLGMRVDWQVIRQRLGSLKLSGGFTYRDSKTEVASAPFTEDNIRSVFAGIRYDWYDFLSGYNLSQLTFTQGLPGFLGGSHTGDADLSRAAGQFDFRKLELSLMRHQPLPGELTLFGALNAQVANGPLLSSEEFGFGGSYIGRAYDPSEITGDSGFSLLLELRSRQLEVRRLGLLQPLLFVDYGAIWNRDSGQDANRDGASLGIGARLEASHGLSAELTLAQPIISSEDSTYRNNGGPRLLFALRAKF